MVSVKEALTLSMLEGVYQFLAALSIVLGLTTVGFITLESSWPFSFFLYSVATLLRLAAGAVMNRMGSVEGANAWNNKYHRFVVIVLNAMVGAVLLGRLGWDGLHGHAWYNCAFLTAVFAMYFGVARWTRPNTLGARARSAALTIILATTMGYLAWPQLWGLWPMLTVLGFTIAWVRLRQLQRRFGWADR